MITEKGEIFGEVTESLNPSESKKFSSFYYTLYSYRRLLFAVIVIYLAEHPAI